MVERKEIVDRVLVTGGARNIGAAIVRRMAEDGYKPVVLDIVEPEQSDCEYYKVDLRDVGATEEALARVVQNSPITRLVNCVGIVKPALIENVRMDDFELVMRLNVGCAIQCVQALLPGMRAAKMGRIVNISSRTALGKELRTSYSASKAALHGLVKTWALETAGDGVTANAVAPGTVETTAFYQNNPRDDARTKAIIDAIPARRIGTPDDIANAVSFFLDARSGFVNGQVLYVCGALTVGRAS